jgi:hypothetical protein
MSSYFTICLLNLLNKFLFVFLITNLFIQGGMALEDLFLTLIYLQ